MRFRADGQERHQEGVGWVSEEGKIKRLRVGLEEGSCREKASELGTTQVCLGLQGQRGPKALRERKLETDLGGHSMPGKAALCCPPNPCSFSVTRMEL